MKFRMIHNNFNVLDLDKSLNFYAEALDMKETRRISAPDGSFIIVYLKCDKGDHLRQRIPPRFRDGRLRGRLCQTQSHGLHLLRKSRNGNLLHFRSR